MVTYLDDQSVIAMASIGMLYSDSKYSEYKIKAKYYVESYRMTNDKNCPTYAPVTQIMLLCNNIYYSLKVTLYSPDEYAVFSSENYSIFKKVQMENNSYKICWNSQIFYITFKSNNNVFLVEVDRMKTINIQVVEDSDQSTESIFLCLDDKSTEKLNIVLKRCLSKFNNILNGFVLPEPFFTLNLNKELDTMFAVLRDPLLPILQFQEILENIKSQLPSVLLTELQQVIASYTSHHSSVFARFPSKKILTLISRYLNNIGDRNTRLNMEVVLRPVLELAEIYSSGIRGNAKHIINDLFEYYGRVESKFQKEQLNENGNIYQKMLSVSDVISHNCLSQKNKLILCLIDYLEKYLPGLIMDLRTTINKLLNTLTGRIYSQVISKFRELLITGQVPSYEVRKNEIASIFLESINRYSNTPSTGRLENLIHSNTEMFDIISDFFYHDMVDLRKCALEVYIRRAYMAYEMHSFKQSQLPSGHLCVIYQFSCPISSRDINVPNLKRSNSVTLNSHLSSSCNPRKFSQYFVKPVESISPFYLDKDDTTESVNSDIHYEFNLDDKTRDNDADSAISIEGHSLSEISAGVSDQVDFDSIGETSVGCCRNSPSVHSLEELPNRNTVSNVSLDSLVPCKSKRALSILSNQITAFQTEDFIGNMDTGIMIIFNELAEFERNIELIKNVISQSECSDYLEYDYLDQNMKPAPGEKVVVKVVLNDPDLYSKFDNEVSKLLSKFCSNNSHFLTEINVSSITFLLQSTGKTLRYFTFRSNSHFEEDYKVRQIDPALSLQLEIDRLRNYHLERLPVLNRRMYVYLGRHKPTTVAINAEYRMFVRCIINHNDINSNTTTVDEMAREAEKSLLEAMDAYDIAWIDNRANLTSSNHIFFYFHSILCINRIEELEYVVRNIVLKYGHRLWSLRITQAELKLSVKFNSDHISLIPIRLWVHNEGGRSLDISIYREEFQNNLDHKILVSWSPNKEGRYHGVPVDCFYSL